jgi:hypothetical protein
VKPAALVEPLSFREKPLVGDLADRNEHYTPWSGTDKAHNETAAVQIRPSPSVTNSTTVTVVFALREDLKAAVGLEEEVRGDKLLLFASCLEEVFSET